jgi:hypothetical protein
MPKEKPVSDKAPKQRTATGHEIPVPKRSDFINDLTRVSEKTSQAAPKPKT